MSTFAADDGLRWLIIAKGETRVPDKTDVVTTTVLGNYVAGPLSDPATHVGRINHYLLATGRADDEGRAALRRLRDGNANRRNAGDGRDASAFRTQIFDGATMHSGFHEISEANSACTRQFMCNHRIPLAGEDVRGTGARHVEFRAALRLTRCRVTNDPMPTPPPDAPSR